MKSIDWLLDQLNVRREIFFSPQQSRDIVEKRWVAMWFYRCAGKSFLEIARKVGRDHTTVLHGCKTMNVTLKNLAEELLMKYASEVSKTGVSFEPTEPKKITIKIPDYKHSKIVFKEVDENLLPKTIDQHWREHGWNL